MTHERSKVIRFTCNSALAGRRVCYGKATSDSVHMRGKVDE